MGGERFSYRTNKDGVVRIYWQGRCVVTVRGKAGLDLAARLAGADDDGAQSLLRRATGNFKRGNERAGKARRR